MQSNTISATVSPAIRHASSLTDFIRETNGRFFSVQAVKVDGSVSDKKNGHKAYKRLLATPAGQAAAKTAAQLACQIFTDNNQNTAGQEKRGAIRSFRKGNVISFKCGDLRFTADEKEVQRLRDEMAGEKRAKRADKRASADTEEIRAIVKSCLAEVLTSKEWPADISALFSA